MVPALVVNDITCEVFLGMATNTMAISVNGVNFSKEVPGHNSSVKEKTVGHFVLKSPVSIGIYTAQPFLSDPQYLFCS